MKLLLLFDDFKTIGKTSKITHVIQMNLYDIKTITITASNLETMPLKLLKLCIMETQARNQQTK